MAQTSSAPLTRAGGASSRRCASTTAGRSCSTITWAAGFSECPAEKELSDLRRLSGADASPRTGKLSKAPAPGLSSPASGSSHAGPQGIAIQRKLLSRALILQLSLVASDSSYLWDDCVEVSHVGRLGKRPCLA